MGRTAQVVGPWAPRRIGGRTDRGDGWESESEGLTTDLEEESPVWVQHRNLISLPLELDLRNGAQMDPNGLNSSQMIYHLLNKTRQNTLIYPM